MTTVDFITELFCKIEEKIDDHKHPQAKLYPSEVVTMDSSLTKTVSFRSQSLNSAYNLLAPKVTNENGMI